MNHKIVCWGDYAIPVPEYVNWIAMDPDGIWFLYQHKPWPVAKYFEQWNTEGGQIGQLSLADDLCPPESGPWTEQLYWIGD